MAIEIHVGAEGTTIKFLDGGRLEVPDDRSITLDELLDGLEGEYPDEVEGTRTNREALLEELGKHGETADNIRGDALRCFGGWLDDIHNPDADVDHPRRFFFTFKRVYFNKGPYGGFYSYPTTPDGLTEMDKDSEY